MHDVFAAREEALARTASAVTRRPGQLGSIAVVAGTPLVCDWVGRSDAFAALHGPLVRGYALDAVDAVIGDVPSPEAMQVWLDHLLEASLVRRPSRR